MPQDTTGVKSFLSGGIGGMFLVISGHPLDLIKVKLQTSNQSFLQCFQSQFNSGIKSFYRGVVPPLLGVMPIMATTFWAYDLGIKMQRWGTNDTTTPRSISEVAIAGGFSALPAVVVVAPGERIKCLLQISDAGGKDKKTMIQVIKDTIKRKGFFGLYQGTTITLLRDIPGSMAYFTIYEVLKKELAGNDKNSILPIIVAGGVAGMANWALAMPFDVLKSRIQTQETSLGIKTTFNQLVKAEGYRGLYRGLAPALLRAFPANAACFLGVELSLQLMNTLF
ncbi:mitochondrial carnitine/acylcarnitine translocase [Neoconidiobolus thromboides FSU 785]|nr:mitochondrial carnitine/acylcarnitine translocase [Neoconidiobolus thromboides FSU 785]